MEGVVTVVLDCAALARRSRRLHCKQFAHLTTYLPQGDFRIVPCGVVFTTSLDGNKCRDVVAAVFRRRKRRERTRRCVVSRLCGRWIQKRSLARS